ncbi:hypothetical protein AQI88_00240 [Streptomyces cellostaticus]|uniref:Acetoacetate decarboxylase n=2 Tax=Streptomyces cellostaticus TaxID=67285 RepID=A0A124HDZ1_9ACTN|nr:hypothetical protein AQI88_00240 [Streptomyces cellostaticus]
MLVAVWKVSPTAVPDWSLPAGVQPLRSGQWCHTLTCWVDSRADGSVGRELLVLLRVRDEHDTGLCLVEAWGDNAESLAGGQTLWGVAEQPADLLLTGNRIAAQGGRGRAGAAVRARLWPGTPDTAGESEGVFAAHRDRLRLPGRRSLRTRLLQRPFDDRSAAQRIPVRLDGQMRLGQAQLRAAPGGPLDFLAGRRPLTAFSVSDFHCVIGAPAR